MGFATREGLLPAILLMILPFVILAILIMLLPPWDERTAESDSYYVYHDIFLMTSGGLCYCDIPCDPVHSIETSDCCLTDFLIWWRPLETWIDCGAEESGIFWMRCLKTYSAQVEIGFPERQVRSLVRLHARRTDRRMQSRPLAPSFVRRLVKFAGWEQCDISSSRV